MNIPMPDRNDYVMEPASIEDTEWWKMLMVTSFQRLIHFFGSASIVLQQFKDLKKEGQEIDIKKISPNLWNAILSSISHEEQKLDSILCEIPYNLEVAAIIAATTKRNQVQGLLQPPPATKRLRNGKKKNPVLAISIPKIKAATAPILTTGSESDAWCILMSVLAYRVNLLISHKLEEPNHAWIRISDQAMDLVARKYRNESRTDKDMESLLFTSLLGAREKHDFNIIRCAAKAVVLCMLYLPKASKTSRLHQDVTACLLFSQRLRISASPLYKTRFSLLPPPPYDLWISMEGPLSHAEIISKIRVDRCSLKQYLATAPGFGTNISTTSDASFHWYFMKNSDKASLITTLRDVSFLAFQEELENSKQNRWMVLQTSDPGSYLLGLRKDSDLVIRYAAFVLRLKRFGSRRQRPLKICRDMPAYLLVFRHLQAVLEKDEKTIAKQHWQVVLRLSLMAIVSWYGEVRRIGKAFQTDDPSSSSTTSKQSATKATICVPTLDSYGFRVLLCQGLTVLFNSTFRRQGKTLLSNLWNRIQKKPLTASGVDFLDMLNVSFYLGRQKELLGDRINASRDFDVFQEPAEEASSSSKTGGFVETERKASSLGKVYGKIYLKRGTLISLHKFLDETLPGIEMTKAGKHSILFSVIRNGHHSFKELKEIEKDTEAGDFQKRKEEKIMDNYVCLSLRRQELDGGGTGEHLQLPPSDVLLKIFYAFIRDPLTPAKIQFLLLTSLTTKPAVTRNPIVSLPKWRTCHTKIHRDIWCKTFSLQLPLREELSDIEISGNSRMHLMLILMLIELTGLRANKPALGYAAADFLEAIKHLIVADPDRLAKLPLSMIPVTTRNEEIATYGSLFALSTARAYDRTWGSPGIGLHTELFGMDLNPSLTFAGLLGNAGSNQSLSSNKNGRGTAYSIQETKKILQKFHARMLKPEED